MRIVYLYDLEDWALHNVGRLIQPAFAARGHELELVRADDYHARPREADILYLSFSFLYRPGFAYRRYARELICTLHDPFEVSNFTNRLDWARLPLRAVSPQAFDRVSTISEEMHRVLAEHFRCRALYLTPTFPHDADAIGGAVRAARRPSDGPSTATRLFSATNAPARYSWRSVAGRLRYVDSFLYDQRRHLSLRQLASIGIRTHRKNIPWLQRLRRELSADARVSTDFRFGGSKPVQSRAEYLADLASADVYVCTSYMEGGPLPVMEAVLAGLAVLTTPVGQVGRWVADGANGYHCRTYDELAGRVHGYLEDPGLLQAHKRASAAHAQSLSFDPQPWLGFVLG